MYRMHMSNSVNHVLKYFIDLPISSMFEFHTRLCRPQIRCRIPRCVGIETQNEMRKNTQTDCCLLKRGKCYKALACMLHATIHSVLHFPGTLDIWSDKRVYVCLRMFCECCSAVHRPYSTFSTEAISLIIFMQT